MFERFLNQEIPTSKIHEINLIKNPTNMRTSKKPESLSAAEMSVFQLIEKVVEHTADKGIDVKQTGMKYVNELSSRLNLTSDEVIFLSAFINMSDDRQITAQDLANYFEVKTISIFTKKPVLDSLQDKSIIMKREHPDRCSTYFIPSGVIESISEGKLPKKLEYKNLTICEFFNVVDTLLEQRSSDCLTTNSLAKEFNRIINQNTHLHICQLLKMFNLTDPDLVLLLLLCNIFINDQDDHIMVGDIDDYFIRPELRFHVNNLESGGHYLMRIKLVENVNMDGHANMRAWKLTDHCKTTLLREMNIRVAKVRPSKLTSYKNIAKKELFYNENITKQVNELQSILDQKKMRRIQKRLKEEGLRTGFACLFYGAPGTGKTETAQQLARITGRDIMLVDVPSIRSKWVGETEKNIQSIFEYYRAASKVCSKAPILLFNEADALLNRRQENAERSVDKMENAMQNIILQEMEKFEGIMIATTNLANALDPAFERRFLYKIEFEKPTANESKHIWKALLPGLEEADALKLAEKYDFSGGQIENIARKHIVSSIIAERDTIDLKSIEETCDNETLTNKKRKVVGFGARA